MRSVSPGRTGMGTTLSANPMQFACLVATLSEVMTPAKNYAHMEKLAERLAARPGQGHRPA
jgi:glutamate-1-semialdehyde 2,1-aminomutase